MGKNGRKVDWKVYGSFLLVLGILIHTSKVSIDSARQLAFDIRSVDMAYLFMQNMQDMTGTLRNAEASNNAYVLLGKERLLEGYKKSVTDLRERMSQLPQTPGFEFDAATLHDLVEQKIVDMDSAVAERDENGLNHALQVYLTGRWQSLGESIQSEINAIQTRQRQDLESRLGNKQRSIQKTVESITIASLMGILFFAIAVIIIWAEIRKRLAYEVELEQASEFKTQFLANMSHEIRTPMNGVLGMANILAESEMNPQHSHYAKIIKRSSESLLRIVNDILDMSKVEAGKLDLVQEPFDLNLLASDLEMLFGNLAREKGVRLGFNVDKRIPTALLGDGCRVRQILNNIIGNAVKFTDRGSVDVRISRTASDGRSSNIFFEIRDTGIGIASAEQAKVFEAFEQATSSSQKKRCGTGLGLCISKRLVEMMGGTLHMTSRLGEGSTFSFELKLPHAEVQTTKLEVTREAPHQTFGSPKTVLVAEDDLTNQGVILKLLESMGVKADVANDGREALSKAMSKNYDMLLFDVNMPHLNGVDALHIVRKMEGSVNAKAPAYFVTAGSDTLRDINLKELNLMGIIHKPLQADLFRKEIEYGFAVSIAGGDVHAPKPAPGVRHDCPTILVADDSEDNRELLKVYLRAAGPFRIDFAPNGRVALDLFQRNRYNLVLMDIQMPEMCGLEAIRRIRAFETAMSRTATPVLALTGGVSQTEIADCLNAGCSGFCPKPILKEELLSVIQKNLSWDEVPIGRSKAA